MVDLEVYKNIDLSSTSLAVILYAEFMFSYATWKKLPTTFLNQKWLFQPLPPLFTKRRPKKAKKMFHIEGRKYHPTWQKDITLDIFFSSDRSYPWAVFTPLGSQLHTSLRSGCKADPRGVKTALGNTST